MSDRLDALFAEMRGTQPPAAFATADELRLRGRQRAHRKGLAIAGSVLAVTAVATGLGTGLSVLRPDGSGPPVGPAVTAQSAPASPSPSPTHVAGDLRLQPADLGPGEWRPFEAEQLQNKDRWFWALWTDVCPAYRSDRFPSLQHRVSVETVAYRSGGGTSATTIPQIIERYADGWGANNLADVHAAIDLCGTATPPPDEAPRRYTVAADGLAGDESLLVKEESWSFGASGKLQREPDAYIAVVRVRDVVTTVRALPGDAARVRALAERAAARLG